MAEINNQASVNYTYTGARSPQDADSNITRTQVNSATSLRVDKLPLGMTYVPGDNHSFIIRVENTGTNPINDIILTDNLGMVSENGNPINLMNYIPGTGASSLNGGLWAPYDVSTTNPITVNIGTLNSGDVFMFAYSASIVEGTTYESISNTATASGTANELTITASDTSTIVMASYANVEIQKYASSSEVVVGQDFSYTLILENTGNLPATNVVITDNLPEDFSLESVTLNDGSGAVTLDPSDYMLNDGLLTIPATGSALDLTIPAREDGENGRIIVTLNGRFTSVTL